MCKTREPGAQCNCAAPLTFLTAGKPARVADARALGHAGVALAPRSLTGGARLPVRAQKMAFFLSAVVGFEPGTRCARIGTGADSLESECDLL